MAKMTTYIFSFLLTIILPVLCEREHKVHNIVLYPEKHSWCQTTPIKQVVALPGYEPMTIDNNVCVGACYSYSIPRTQPAEPGELIGPYCDSCQPADSKCYHVTLKADSKNSGPETAQKRVQIITNCTCQSCSKIQSTDCEISEENTAELPTDLFSTLFGNHAILNVTKHHDDISELLNIGHTLNETTPKSDPLNKEVLRTKLIQLLTSTIEHNELKQEADVLREAVVALEDTKNRFSADSLMALFTSASTEQVDFEKINEVLVEVRKDREQLEKHRNFGLGNFVPIDIVKSNADINRDVENLGKTFNMKNFGIEGSHAGLGHYKGSHIGMGVQEVLRESNAIPDTHSKPHHHFVGEVQNVGLASGHLSKGPHGSLVVVPQGKVEPKLELQSDNLKPNSEGVVIDYKSPNEHLLHRTV